MDNEVRDMIRAGISEVEKQLLDSMAEIRRDISQMQSNMMREHRELGERVARLETMMSTTRWWYAGLGGAVLLGLKEVVFWAVRDLMPKLEGAFVDLIFWLA